MLRRMWISMAAALLLPAAAAAGAAPVEIGRAHV